MNRNADGFSLIELLLVMAILSVVLGIATPIFADLLDDTRYKADQYAMAMIERSEHFYYTINKQHSFDQSRAQSSSDFTASIETLEKGYIDEVIFQCIENPRWERSHSGWSIAYDLPAHLQGDATLAAWNQSQFYQAEDLVTYQSTTYQARKANKGQVPGLWGSPWQEITSAWCEFNVYEAGDLVVYSDYIYEARMPSQGKSPFEIAYWTRLDH